MVYSCFVPTRLEGTSVITGPKCNKVPGGTLGISGWGCAAGTLEPKPIVELVQLNFATLY